MEMNNRVMLTVSIQINSWFNEAGVVKNHLILELRVSRVNHQVIYLQ